MNLYNKNYFKNIKNKIKGGFFGLAIGDSIGNLNENNINNITDDTNLSLSVLKGFLVNYKNPIEYIKKYFINWYKYDGIGIGNLTKLVFDIYNKKKDWNYSVTHANKFFCYKNAGNGSLMRTLPISVIFNDINIILYYSEKISRLTHTDKRCIEACKLYNLLAYKLYNKENKDNKDIVLYNIFEKHSYYNKFKNLNIKNLNGGSFVKDTLLAVLTIFYKTNNFESLLYESTNISGDKDTIGSLSCALGGIYYGYKSINKKYLKELKIKKKINKLCNQLFELKIKQIKQGDLINANISRNNFKIK